MAAIVRHAQDSAVTATVVVELSTAAAQPIIRTVTLHAANGRGVTSADLHLLEAVGLQLPGTLDTLPEVTATAPASVTVVRELSPSRAVKRVTKAPAVKAIPATRKTPTKAITRAKAPAVKAPAVKAPAAGKRVYRVAPPSEVLILDYQRYGGNVKAVAEAHGVPRHTAQAWITRLRRNGLLGD